VAEQSVIVNSVSSGNNSGNTSGGTQVMERPQQVDGVGGTAKSAGSGKTYRPPGGLEMGPKAIPFAAVSFVSGLVGLLVANLLLGPLAIVLGLVGLRADSNRRVRAALGILLGVADIVVFVLLAAHAGAHHGSLSWSFLSH
jgi:hypothetical protein